MIDVTLLLLGCILIFAFIALYFKNKNLKESLQRLAAAQARAAAREQQREKDQATWANAQKSSTGATAKPKAVAAERRRPVADRAAKKPAPDKK